MFGCGKWMHKENVLRMSHKGFLFFLTITQFKESTFWDFFCMLIFNNVSNANLLDVFL